MHAMSMVDCALQGRTAGGRPQAGLLVLALGVLLTLSGCSHDEAPSAPWRAQRDLPPASLGPAPVPAVPVTPMSPKAPSMQVLPERAPAAPAQRGPCLTKWGSPRLDAPAECQAKLTRTSGRTAGRGGYKLGRPYTVNGKTYVPAEDPDYDETGIASWYGKGFHGGPTANGEVYDMHRLTAAHRTLPMPSYAYVHNLANGRTIMVRINNRGPFRGNRIIDLSKEAARLLDFKGRGLAKVRVTYAGPAPLDGNDQVERAYLEKQPWYRQEVTMNE